MYKNVSVDFNSPALQGTFAGVSINIQSNRCGCFDLADFASFCPDEGGVCGDGDCDNFNERLLQLVFLQQNVYQLAGLRDSRLLARHLRM